MKFRRSRSLNITQQTIVPCPTDADLERAIAGDLAAEQMTSLEEHLSHCAACRFQMDKLAHVSAIEELASSFGDAVPIESASLRSVMQRLLDESKLDSGAARFAASPTRDVLPSLQPTTKAGFLGRLGDIDIRQMLGRGGMGVVFEGVDSILNRTVAVKVLSPHLVGDNEAKNRFLREAQAAAALTHSNIVGIHSVSEADGMPYLVLKFVDGESLAQRLLRVGKLSFEEVVRIGIETARGLAAAHQVGLIHRDIKPSNILIEKTTGSVNIADFGLAKLVNSDTLTQLGTIAGTPAYMSPEQTTSQALDGRADLFSLGVLLYEASTGVSPFAADSPYVTLDKIRNHQPASVCIVNPKLPKWFGAVVDKLLAKDPKNRFESADGLIEALEGQTAPAIRFGLFGHPRKIVWMGMAVAATVALLVASRHLVDDRNAQLKTSPSNTASNKVESFSGFLVDQDPQPFATLADAIAAAHDKSIIEVHGNGPFPSEAITIKGKRLTIRAAVGCAPTFVPDPAQAKNQSQFLFSESDLRFEGINVSWPIESTVVKFEETGERCVVAVGGGNLTMSSCRVIAGPAGCCVGARGKEIVIRNCHLVSPSGTCIAWPQMNSNVTIEQCLLESRTALFTRVGPNTAQALLRIAHNTVVSERLMTVMLNNQNRRPLRLLASHNIFDCPVLVAVIPSSGPTSNPTSKMSSMLRETLSWQDESNLYRNGMRYITANLRSQPFGTAPSGLDTLDEWLAFWKQPASKSIAGNIEFESRDAQSEHSWLRVGSVTQPTGPLPPGLGANPVPGRNDGLLQ